MSDDNYFDRQIEAITRALATALFKKETLTDGGGAKKRYTFDGENLTSYMVFRYLEERKINEAEDILFRAIEENHDETLLVTAIAFYRRLSRLSEDELKAAGFAYDEVALGLRDVLKIYGIDEDML